MEAIKRNGQNNANNIRDNYSSYTAGVEYVLNRIFDKIWDANIFIEYSNDDRSNDSTDILQNDIFIAYKLLFNDISGSEFTTGLTLDLDGGGDTANIEFSRRITDNFRFTSLYQLYWSTNNKDILHNFRRDNYLGLKLVRYF